MTDTPQAGSTSRERMEELWAAHDAAFHPALRHALAEVPGLNGDFEHSGTSVWVFWGDDATSGYWVFCNLRWYTDRAEDQMPGYVTVSYRDGSGGESRSMAVLSEELSPERARDVTAVAADIVAAIRAHGPHRHDPPPPADQAPRPPLSAQTHFQSHDIHYHAEELVGLTVTMAGKSAIRWENTVITALNGTDLVLHGGHQVTHLFEAEPTRTPITEPTRVRSWEIAHGTIHRPAEESAP
ncbi:hypothetical protein Misp01_22210 [Microtetraspora sp. NBRC 13810]|uniref:hypothetical protein n=1 Tax=Microtetraspora sp. NBRC 13810 TaxID=3030990 RepID=UPI0024A05E79|nr:hypothetical protein [Microtetraspora sp. NBRC 13810]GLW07091.1 hypothetical protein Misp01_22210 [Microtetraspora sp. NBRC 13810]